MKLQVTARTNTRGRSQPQLLTYLAGKTFQLLWVAPKTTAWWNWWRKPHVSSSSANPQGTSGWLPPPKGAGSRAGGGYGWCRGCGWLWMGFVETRSVVLALPSLQNTALGTTVVSVGLSPPHSDGFCPFKQLWQCFACSDTAPHNATSPLHLAPCTDCFQHTPVLFPTQALTKDGTTDAPPVAPPTPAPDALGGRNSPSFPLQSQFFRK